MRFYSIFSFTKREQITPKCLVLSGFAVSCDYFDDKILQRGERKQLRVEFPMVTGSPSDTWQTETIYFDDKTGNYMTTINDGDLYLTTINDNLYPNCFTYFTSLLVNLFSLFSSASWKVLNEEYQNINHTGDNVSHTGNYGNDVNFMLNFHY